MGAGREGSREQSQRGQKGRTAHGACWGAQTPGGQGEWEKGNQGVAAATLGAPTSASPIPRTICPHVFMCLLPTSSEDCSGVYAALTPSHGRSTSLGDAACAHRRRRCAQLGLARKGHSLWRAGPRSAHPPRALAPRRTHQTHLGHVHVPNEARRVQRDVEVLSVWLLPVNLLQRRVWSAGFGRGDGSGGAAAACVSARTEHRLPTAARQPGESTLHHKLKEENTQSIWQLDRVL